MEHGLARLSMSAAEFLAWDAHQTVRQEYFRGHVLLAADGDASPAKLPPLLGDDDRHATVLLNLAMALRQHLRGSPCRTFVSGVKLHIAAADGFFYPDLMVTCSLADAADRLIKREPSLVIEVLSHSTAAYDLGDKFAAYRLVPSLAEYLLVDIDSRRCDVCRKGADGLWVLHPFEPGQTLHLASVALDISADELWAEVETSVSDSKADVATQVSQA